MMEINWVVIKKQREQRSRENKEAERTKKQREQGSRENKEAERTK
jgi:hypothetical protein